ncbi:unnamed protein product [Lepidochelys olivacea]
MRLLLDSILFCTCSPSSALIMAGEIVYADLNILKASSKPLHPARHLNHHLHQRPRCHWITAGLGAAGILILLGAVIAISVWGKQFKINLCKMRHSEIPPSCTFLIPTLL